MSILRLIPLLCFCVMTTTTFVVESAFALPAFPGAVGFGSDTVGGRGGKVIEVTNLNEGGTGSLRAACDASGPRIVVFRTGGTIKLTSNIGIVNPYITIAGQTAPGDGIMLRGAAITIKTHDVIIRGLRLRIGDDPNGPDPENRDAFQVQSKNLPHDVIVDHCSFSWAIDETLTLYTKGTKDITISNCILSEALNNSIHPEGSHSKGALSHSGVERVAFIRNLFAHNWARNPRFTGRGGVVVNNVIYNRGYKALEISGLNGDVQSISVVGNYFKKGLDYKSSLPIYLSEIKSGTKVYVSDNDCSDYSGCVQLSGGNNPIVQSPPIWLANLSTQPSNDTLDLVLDDVGAILPHRDPVDTRVIASVRNGTGRIIDSQDDVGGWPNLDAGVPLQDTDHDGMPDTWEIAQGLDPNDKSDGNGDRNSDGYTNIEEYINGLFSTNDEQSGNTSPVLGGITASPSTPIYVDESTQLTATATDVDGDNLTYNWSVAPGEGSIVGTGETVSYTPSSISSEQTFTITVTIMDGKGGTDAGTVDVTVVPAITNTPPSPTNVTVDIL